MDDRLKATLRDEFVHILENIAYDQVAFDERGGEVQTVIRSQRGRMALMWAACELGLVDEQVIHKPSSFLGLQVVQDAREHALARKRSVPRRRPPSPLRKSFEARGRTRAG